MEFQGPAMLPCFYKAALTFICFLHPQVGAKSYPAASLHPDLGCQQIRDPKTIFEGYLIFQLEASKLNIKTKTPLHYLSLHL